MNTTLHRMISGSTGKSMGAGVKRHGNLTFHPHLVDHGYQKAKRAAGGAPSNSTDLLRMAAHHGVTAKTHHGPGGIKPHQMKLAKPRVAKTGAKIVHISGQVKIPSSMHHVQPGKGLHNHIKKVI